MIKRHYGEAITLETRSVSHDSVDKKKRYKQIIECLQECPNQTAKEIAYMMAEKCYIPTSERNFTAPRLTEMSKMGIVEPVGKKRCNWTRKTVTVYNLRNL